jgi:hypothetical protein
MYKKTP